MEEISSASHSRTLRALLVQVEDEMMMAREGSEKFNNKNEKNILRQERWNGGIQDDFVNRMKQVSLKMEKSENHHVCFFFHLNNYFCCSIPAMFDSCDAENNRRLGREDSAECSHSTSLSLTATKSKQQPMMMMKNVWKIANKYGTWASIHPMTTVLWRLLKSKTLEI